MKKLIAICAAALATLAYAATDMGVLVTSKNITDYAKAESGSGGTATITIVDTNGTANAVTVYNKSQMDSALSGKASASDVTALQSRATALEGATNTLNSALAGKLDTSGGTITGPLVIANAGEISITDSDGYGPTFGCYGIIFNSPYGSANLSYPVQGGTFARIEDIPSSWSASSITNAPWLLSSAISSWALAASKPSYNFSEIGNKPTTISGYGITDAKINNGTITLGSNSITPLTSYTETDPTALKPSQLTVDGTAMTTSSAAVELGAYYITTVDGKPHLMLR